MTDNSANIGVPKATTTQQPTNIEQPQQTTGDSTGSPIVAIINYRDGDEWQQISVHAGQSIELRDDIGEPFVEVQALRSRGN